MQLKKTLSIKPLEERKTKGMTKPIPNGPVDMGPPPKPIKPLKSKKNSKVVNSITFFVL